MLQPNQNFFLPKGCLITSDKMYVQFFGEFLVASTNAKNDLSIPKTCL